MKKQLLLEDTIARQLYKTADPSFKVLLEESFGKDFFSDKLINRIKSIDDIYTELGQKAPLISNYLFLPYEDREQAVYLQYQLDISKCFNQGWKPDFTNHNEYKYYIWWERKSSGWSLSEVDSYYCYSALGAGFYFKKREDAEYCAKLFADIYKATL